MRQRGLGPWVDAAGRTAMVAFAGLRQPLYPVLRLAEPSPGPQWDAFEAAFGIANGPEPDGFGN